MNRIVFACDLGENHGHLWRLLPIARALQSHGHEVMFGLTPMAAAGRYLAPHGIRSFACPRPVGVAALGREIATYADILAVHGAAQADLLGRMVQDWQNLYAALRADLIVIDHAPFALLAARRAGICSVQVGDGFTIPPTLSPAPCFRPWETGAAEARAKTQASVERNVQALFDLPQSLSLSLTASYTRLLTWPELDHYAAWRPAGSAFLGPMPQPDEGETLTWQRPASARVFVYLHMQPWLDTVLAALADCDAEVIAVIPGAGADLTNRHRNLKLYRQPVRLASLLADCTLAITHAGHGTALNCLLAGVPMLLLPLHVEQLMVTERVAALGAGLGILPAYVETRFGEVLNKMLRNPRYGEAAFAAAKRYRNAPPDRALQEITGLIEQAAAQRR